MPTFYGSSQTNPNYANYKGSLTYAPQSRPNVNVPFIGTKTTKPAPTINTVTTGGGGGGNYFDPNKNVGMLNGQQFTDYNQYLKAGGLELSAPSQPEFDSSPYDYAIGILDQTGQNAEQSLQGETATLQNQLATGKARIGQQVTEAEQMTEAEKVKAQAQSDQDVNELSQAQSEIQQGISARYGQTTGTGAFASEITGRAAIQSIGKSRQQLRDNLQKLQSDFLSYKGEAQNRVDDMENQTQSFLQQAKQKFQEQISQISMQKGMLLGQKAERKQQLLSDYQNTVRQVQEYNTNFKREIAMQQEQIKNQMIMESYKATVNAYQKQGLSLEEIIKNAEQVQGSTPAGANFNYTQSYGDGGKLTFTSAKKREISAEAKMLAANTGMPEDDAQDIIDSTRQ